MTDPSISSSKAPSGPRASFGVRFGAALIDGIMVFVLNLLLGLVLGPVGRALGVAASLAYYTYLEGSPSGQTVGKRALGIRVVSFANGGPLGYGQAAVRWVARILSTIPCGLGYFWMLWDKEKQTWHDKLANCVVVPVSDYPVSAWPG